MDGAERMQRAMERAEDDLVEQLNAGEISQADFNAEMREMARDYAAAAEDAAQDAYEAERGRW